MIENMLFSGMTFHTLYNGCQNSILNELSECLKEDVIAYNCRVLIQRVPFFENAEENFLSDVLTKLRPEIFQPGDFIIKEGTIGKRMYFIQDGSVDIIKGHDIATTLTEGSYFGEICLLANTKRCASVKAVTYCQLFSLDKNHFDEVLVSYPMMKRTMKGIAAQRLYKIGENPRLVSRGEELAQDLSVAHEILKEPEGINTLTKATISEYNLEACRILSNSLSGVEFFKSSVKRSHNGSTGGDTLLSPCSDYSDSHRKHGSTFSH